MIELKWFILNRNNVLKLRIFKFSRRKQCSLINKFYTISLSSQILESKNREKKSFSARNFRGELNFIP
jgi:hypothetical protein